MDLRRLSLMFTLIGGALLLAATTFLVTASFGRVATTATDDNASGSLVMIERATPSIMENSAGTAYGWLLASAALVVIFGLLTRYGGYVGPILVIIVMQLMVFASILTIGIFFFPGAGALGVAALMAIADRSNRRSARVARSSTGNPSSTWRPSAEPRSSTLPR